MDPTDKGLAIVDCRARRRGVARRALQRVGSTFAQWLERMVPPAQHTGRGELEPPSPIRFPFF